MDNRFSFTLTGVNTSIFAISLINKICALRASDHRFLSFVILYISLYGNSDLITQYYCNNKFTWCFHKLNKYIVFTMQTYKKLILNNIFVFKSKSDFFLAQNLHEHRSLRVVINATSFIASPGFTINKTPAQAFTPPADEKKMGTISGYLCTAPSTAQAGVAYEA